MNFNPALKSGFFSYNEKSKGLPLLILNVVLTAVFFMSHFFLANDYPVCSSEMLFSVSIFSAGLLLFFVPALLLFPEWICYGFLYFIFFDFSLLYNNSPIDLLPGSRWIFFFIFLFLSFAITKLLKKKSVEFFTILFVVMIAANFAAAVLGPSPKSISIKENEKIVGVRPDNILVIILDEHLGFAGFPQENQTAAAVKKRLEKFYIENGFDVYEKAYANHRFTRWSLFSILNYSGAAPSALTDKLNSNKFLEKFFFEGYALNFYQSSFEKFCPEFTGRYRKCYEYNDNTVKYLESLSLPAIQKTVVILASFLISTHDKFEIFKKWAYTGPIPSANVLTEVRNDMIRHKAGGLYFVHLLLPHHPYIYNSNCNIKSIFEWRANSMRGSNTHAKWQEKYDAYMEQVACVNLEMEELINDLKNQDLYDKTTIIIFGDHGSRIAMTPFRYENKDRFSNRDLIDNFSSLLLIKKAHVSGPGKYIFEKISTAEVLGNFAELKPEGNKKDFEKTYIVNYKNNTFLSMKSPEL